MATLDIFNNDAFQLTQLSQLITDVPRVPTLIGDMGLFREGGIATTVFMIERIGSSIKLLPTAPRGGVGEPVGLTRGKVFPLSTFHIPATWSVLADEVQGVRATGTESEVEQVETVVQKKLGVVRDSMDLTHEYQRVGAIKGLIIDADGSSLLDLYAAFGMTQTAINWDLSNDVTPVDMQELTADLKHQMRMKLGGRRFTGIGSICSYSFFVALITTESIKKAYDRWQDGAYLRTDQTDAPDFQYMGVTYWIYEGGTSAGDFIDDGYAWVFPLGVPDLFKTEFAPADYMETVNTTGLPFYAKQEPMPFNKGIKGEAQSNPLHYCSLPEAVFKIRNHA